MADQGDQAGSATGDRHVLVVDDDRTLQQVIRWALEDEGLLVETAGTGSQAVERATRRRPALLVLDYGLPELDGAGVAAALRGAHDVPVPILLITADGRSAEKARRVGALDYLQKPFEVDDLVAIVRRLLGGR